MKKPKKIGIVTKHLRPSIVKFAKELQDYIGPSAKVYFEKELAKKCNSKNILDLKKPNVDLIISLGGDGTILATVGAIAGAKIPILGINKGYMGFMTEIEDKYEADMDNILAGRCFTDERIKLDVFLNKKKVGTVLNDAVLFSAKPAKIQKYIVELNNMEIETLLADGIIIATPTGSTAYGMSAGGPIIDPELDAFEIVPVSPFRLSARAIVVPPTSVVKVRTGTARDSVLVLDGFYNFKIKDKDVVTIKKSKDKVYFVKFEENFYERVKRKLV